MIYLLYAQQYVDAIVKASETPVVVTSAFVFIFGGVLLNAVLEVVLSALVSTPVVYALNKIKR